MTLVSQYAKIFHGQIISVTSAYKSLHLICQSISSSPSNVRLCLYLSLVHSKLTYCSQLWQPYLIRDIISLERRAAKFVLNNYSSNYKARLTSLYLLPLMYWFELQDILFLVKCMKEPADNFDTSSYISFITSNTRASSTAKLRHNISHFSTTQHFYFNRVIHLWNTLPSIDISESFPSIKHQVICYL